MNLSIIIPAYNEEKRISRTLEAYCEFFSKRFNKNVEIIVVPNGCTDKTAGVVAAYMKKYPILTYYEFKGRIGKGGAIIEGFKKAKGDFVGYVDADLATPPEAFYDLIENINGHDGIIASRWIKGSVISKKQPIRRIIASRVFNTMVRILFWMNFRDTQCGAKLFTKKAIDDVKNELGITQFSFDIDLLYRLKVKGYKIIEIPTTWHDQEKSTLVLKKTIPNMFFSILRLRLLYSKFKFIVNTYDKIHDSYLK